MTAIKPRADALPRPNEKLEKGRFGTTLPKTYGFTIVAKVIPGREDTVRAYGHTVEKLILEQPHALAPLALHYLRRASLQVRQHHLVHVHRVLRYRF